MMKCDSLNLREPCEDSKVLSDGDFIDSASSDSNGDIEKFVSLKESLRRNREAYKSSNSLILRPDGTSLENQINHLAEEEEKEEIGIS
jgi:hypothetical protein